jgi:hypothetical protein
MINYKLAKFLSRFMYKGNGFSLQVDGVGRYVRKARLFLDIRKYSWSWGVKVNKLFFLEDYIMKTKNI